MHSHHILKQNSLLCKHAVLANISVRINDVQSFLTGCSHRSSEIVSLCYVSSMNRFQNVGLNFILGTVQSKFNMILSSNLKHSHILAPFLKAETNKKPCKG